MVEMILPGTYIQVRDEGLISAGRISTGNIGVVGTALKGVGNEPCLISSVSEAREKFGQSDGDATLIRAIELIYQNGGRTVYAVRVGDTSQFEFKKTRDTKEVSALTLASKLVGTLGNQITVSVTAADDNKKNVVLKTDETTEEYTIANLAALADEIGKKSTLAQVVSLDQAFSGQLPNNTTGGSAAFAGGSDGDYKEALQALENKIVNIVVLAGQDTGNDEMLTALTGHLTTTAGIQRERIGVMGLGFGKQGQDVVPEDVIANNERLILVSPGITITQAGEPQRFSAGYLAAAIAGVISSLPVQTSPTNKPVTIEGLTTEFNHGSLQKLVQKRVLAVEQRNGFRIVKGITTHDGAWQQITTRRIVDYAIYGVRSSCNPYIGKLNNVRVRGAMKATLDGFLTRMVDSEALVSYELDVSATRAQEIAGEAIVTMTLAPTFSIDFVNVTMYLS